MKVVFGVELRIYQRFRIVLLKNEMESNHATYLSSLAGEEPPNLPLNAACGE